MVKLFEFPNTSELEKKHGVVVPNEIKEYHAKLGLCMFGFGLLTGIGFAMMYTSVFK